MPTEGGTALEEEDPEQEGEPGATDRMSAADTSL